MLSKNSSFSPVKKCWNCKSESSLYQDSNKTNFPGEYEVWHCESCGRYSHFDFDWEERNEKAYLILRDCNLALNSFEKRFLTNLLNFGRLSEKQETIFFAIWEKYMQ